MKPQKLPGKQLACQDVKELWAANEKHGKSIHKLVKDMAWYGKDQCTRHDLDKKAEELEQMIDNKTSAGVDEEAERQKEAKLEGRLAVMDAKLGAFDDSIDETEKRQEARLSAVEGRLATMEQRVDKLAAKRVKRVKRVKR